MKKQIFALLLLLNSFIYAQYIESLDSLFYTPNGYRITEYSQKQMVNGQLEHDFSQKFSYNISGEIDSVITDAYEEGKLYLSELEVRVNKFKHPYLSRFYSNSQGAWHLIRKDSVSFSAFNKPLIRYYYQLQDSLWQLYRKDSVVYNSDQRVKEWYLLYFFKGNWHPNQFIIEYDSSFKPILYIANRKNNQGAWYVDSKVELFYDKGRLIEELTYEFNEELEQLVKERWLTIEYAENGTMQKNIFKEWKNEQWVLESEAEFTYENPTALHFKPNNAYTPNLVHIKTWPNPFNPSIKIELNVNEIQNVEMDLFNINGQLIKHIYKGALNAGTRSFTLKNESWPSGTYFVRIKNSKNMVYTKKITLLK